MWLHLHIIKLVMRLPKLQPNGNLLKLYFVTCLLATTCKLEQGV